MKKIFLTHLTDHKNRIVSFIAFITLLVSIKTNSQWVNPFLVPFHNTQSYAFVQSQNTQPETVVNKWTYNPELATEWERLQTIEIPQYTADGKVLPPVKLNLDQVRNGSSTSPVVPPTPAPWVNGNAGASNAHYVEGYSIPYRCVIDNLPLGNFSVDIEWDVRHSNSSAIDFVTNYNVMDYPAGSHINSFGHVQEVINPLSEAGDWDQGTSTVIPAPSFPGGAPAEVSTYYTAIMGTTTPDGPANKFTIYNGSISGMSYVLPEGNVTVAASSTRLRIFFSRTNPDNSTVIIAWGGHIAKGEGVWGAGNSASAVSGSPYHTRLIEWDPDGAGAGGASSIGNQDRSLSADAVLDPPICDLQGPTTLECSSVSTFTSGVASSDLGPDNDFAWEIINGSGCNASIVDGTNVEYATVNSGTGCNCTFTVKFKLLKTTNNNTQLELSNCTLVVTTRDTRPPVITSTCLSPTTIDCPATPVFTQPTATDACTPSSAITYTSSDASTTSCGQARTVTRTWTISDACSNTVTCSQTITVRDITPPVITGVGVSQTIDCPNNPVFSNPTASDACGTGTFTPTFTDNSVTSCGQARTVTRKWTATDACGNTATASQVITVRDITAPVISGVGSNQTIDCPAEPVFSSPTASDACGTGTFTPTFSDATTNSCGQARTVTRKWTATDACGNTSTASQTITVRDITAPVISGVGGPQTIDCPANPVFSSPTASDACGSGTFTPTFTDVTVNSCGQARTVTRKWTATDACGNTSTASQTITVRDITPPLITCPPDATVDCDVSTAAGASAVGSATATDACGNSTVTSNDQTTNTGCVTVITRTWTARDACGNTATCVQHIIQKDLTPPVITCNAIDGSATASDNCGALAAFYLSGGTWTAIDQSGNITTQSCPVAGRIAPSTLTAEEKPETKNNEQKESKTQMTPNSSPLLVHGISVKAIPNPFNDKVKFVITTPESGYGSLEVMNMLGQKIKTVYQGKLNTGVQSFEMLLPQTRFSSLFYILKINGKQVTGKLIQHN